MVQNKIKIYLYEMTFQKNEIITMFKNKNIQIFMKHEIQKLPTILCYQQ